MNYQKIYDDICKRGQERILEKGIYSERHHIIPKCLGGSNDKSNITKLTAREHFLVHYILAIKLYSKHSGINLALHKMAYSNNIRQERYIPSSKQFNIIREACNNIINPMHGKKHSAETKRKMSEKAKNRIISEETKKKISLANSGSNNKNFGIHRSVETKKKISNSLKGNVISEETRKKISLANKGKSKSDETRRKLSIANKGRKLSPEAAEKCRIVNLGRKHTAESRKNMGDSRLGKKRGPYKKKNII